jgi:hypothetical protein
MLFVYEYRNITEIFHEKNFISYIVLLLAVILVHTVKAGRLYIILYGSEVDTVSYIKTYCKVTPVSVVLPYKIGEFFRIYCYGNLIGNFIKGIVTILLDRFMDTIALITVVVLVGMFYGFRMTSFMYLLLIFLVTLLFVYYAYPGVYRFWKKYLLRSDATEHKLTLLRILETLNVLYSEIEQVTKGRGMILYIMSLFAWGIEIGSLKLLNTISGEGNLAQVISDYMTSAMSGSQSIELKQFVIVSVTFLIIIYVIIKAVKMTVGKKRQ